jgi:hypothetical protein
LYPRRASKTLTSAVIQLLAWLTLMSRDLVSY